MTPPARIKRILCLWFPDWPIQRLIKDRPEIVRNLFLLTESTARGEFVRFCNRPAKECGIVAGMPVAEARSLALPQDQVLCERYQPEQDVAALVEAALHCDAYSPCVGVEESEPPSCLILDVTGLAAFFGGELDLVHLTEQDFRQRHLQILMGMGDSVGSAWAAAHYLAKFHEPCLLPATPSALLAPLPLGALRLTSKTLEKLHRLGLRTVGQLNQIQRSLLLSRFGSEVGMRLDQLYGMQEELITPCRPVPLFKVVQTLEYSITHLQTLQQLAFRLIRQLLSALEIHQSGTRHLQLCFQTEKKTEQTLDVRLCQVTASAAQVEDILRVKIDRLRIDAPIIQVYAEALEISRLEQTPQELFEGEHQKQHALSVLLNRLSGRLGHQSVTQPSLTPDPIPERSTQLIPATEKTKASAGMNGSDLLPLDRPICLFPEPKAIDVLLVAPDSTPAVLFVAGRQVEIISHRGPERIESGWWNGPQVRRDYFGIETSEGRRYWIFRRLQDERWFLHGEFL